MTGENHGNWQQNERQHIPLLQEIKINKMDKKYNKTLLNLLNKVQLILLLWLFSTT